MAKGVIIKGGKALLDRIRNMPKVLQEEIGFELGDASNQIVKNAKLDAPVHMGELRNGLSAVKIQDLKFEIVSAAHYSAYVEFGTRSKVSIPAGLQEYAAQFRGGRKSNISAMEAIYEWCRLKGIEKGAWFHIYLSIMINGIEPQPFFFPNINKQKPLLVKNINAVVKSL